MTFRSTLLILILFLVFTTGCRQRSTEIYDLFGNDSSSEELDRVTLTIFVPGRESPYAKEVFQVLEKKTEKELNLGLNPVFFDMNNFRFLGEIETILQRPESCDLFYIAGINGATRFPGGGDILRPLYHQGLIQDLTDLFPQYAPNYYTRLDPLTLDSYRRDGRLLAVPNNMIQANRPSVIVREDFFRDYNLNSIDNLDKFEHYLELVKQNEEDNITPLVISSSQSLQSIFANAYGYAVLDEELQLVYRWDDPNMQIIAWENIPEYEEIMERAQSWFLKGFIKRGELFAEQYLLMDTPGWGAWISDAYASSAFNWAAAAAGQDIRYLEFPLFPEATAQRRNQYYEGFAIPSDSENSERALMFIEWVHQSQSNYDLIRYGLEGKQYRLKENMLVYPEDVSEEDRFINWENNALADMNFERLPADGGIASSSEDYIKSYLEKTSYAPHAGFVLNKEIMNTFARRKSYKFMDERVGRGQFTTKSLGEFREKQNKDGLAAIVQSAQDQLNQWQESR